MAQYYWRTFPKIHLDFLVCSHQDSEDHAGNQHTGHIFRCLTGEQPHEGNASPLDVSHPLGYQCEVEMRWTALNDTVQTGDDNSNSDSRDSGDSLSTDGIYG